MLARRVQPMRVPSQASPLPEASSPSLGIPPGVTVEPRVADASVPEKESCSGTEILRWRRELRAQGGDPRSLDWLLDAAGGLNLTLLQDIRLHPERSVTLLTSKREMEELWRQQNADADPLQYLVAH